MTYPNTLAAVCFGAIGMHLTTNFFPAWARKYILDYLVSIDLKAEEWQ